MKILVTGGRDFLDHQFVDWSLGQVYEQAIEFGTPLRAVIHGGAPGADSLAGSWAEENDIQNVICPANWNLHKRSAGPIRNARMLFLEPDLVVAFPGGTGTAHMVETARRNKFVVWEADAGQSVFDYLKSLKEQ